MGLWKMFTKSQFSAMTSEIVRLAREFNDHGFDSSVTFYKDSITLYVHYEVKCICSITLHKDRYVCVKEYKELEDAALKANIPLNGRYVTMMRDAIANDSDNGSYFIDL